MPRYDKRTDGNQTDVVADLREKMFLVKTTSHIGWGFPDFIAQRNGKGAAVELKAEGKRKKLTPKEIEMREWLVAGGLKIIVAETVEEIEREFK